MDEDFRAFLDTPEPGAKTRKRHPGYNAFGWTVALLLLCGFVMASWIASFYVYNHPEDPDCYHLLKQLNRIDPIKRFEVTAAPEGKFFTARELYDMYLAMSAEDLDAKNDELLRNYLRNYSQTKAPIPYLTGNFTTSGVYELGKSDLFPTGMVAVANSADCPQVQIEHIYPTAFSNVPRARQMLALEPQIHLDKSFSLVTVVHVSKLENNKMLFTVVPLDYGQYAYKQGISSIFRLDPPTSLNLEASLPVVKPEAMQGAEKTFALYRKNKGMLANGNMLTLPKQSASVGSTALYTAQNLPPEALQPYKPAVEADATPENTENAVADNTAPVTPPSDELPPATPSAPATEISPQAAPQLPPAPVAPAPPVALVSQSAQSSTAPVIEAPAVAKAPAAPMIASTSVKQEKVVPRTSALPSPAPVVRQLTHIQPPQPVSVSTTSIPVKPKPAVAVSTPQSTPKPVVAVVPAPTTPRVMEYPSPAPVEYAEAVPPETQSSGVKLSPFLAPPAQVPPPQQPQATVSQRPGNWAVYSPGMMPRGRLISMEETTQLADLGIGRERLYVGGRFVVTASSDGRAVLRPVGYNGVISGTTVRMVVEYPNGARVPVEGAQVARGPLRPFQIIDIRRGDDGHVNIYAREVTAPVNQANNPNSPRYERYRMVQQDTGAYN